MNSESRARALSVALAIGLIVLCAVTARWAARDLAVPERGLPAAAHLGR